MQAMYCEIKGVTEYLEIPAPEDELLPGVRWGAFDELFTPAYWFGQAWQHGKLGTYSSLQLGRTLSEEVSACLLGGFGIRAELGLMAFRRLCDRGLIHYSPSAVQIAQALESPFHLHGRTIRYRFPRQKAQYLAVCLDKIRDFSEPGSDVDLRDSLLILPGIGLKTASWIVRNYRKSNHVAIIDIHILRAGRHMGLFNLAHNPQRHYLKLEETFLKFSEALKVEASTLDGLIWDYMRRIAPGRRLRSNRREPQTTERAC